MKTARKFPKGRCGQFSLDRDFLPFQSLAAQFFGGDNDGSITLAETRAGGKENIPVGKIGIGVKGYRRDVVCPAGSFLVQALNVLQNMRKAEGARPDPLCGQPVKHEGIVGVGTVGEFEFLSGGAKMLRLARRSGLHTSSEEFDRSSGKRDFNIPRIRWLLSPKGEREGAMR